MDKVLVLKFMI